MAKLSTANRVYVGSNPILPSNFYSSCNSLEAKQVLALGC